ncbi:hypothetical protein GC176_10360 [bacterium]|nr:hypothetical protein [bacterium]
MMITLLLYAYCKDVFSSRKIMSRCGEDIAFRVIVGEDIPDFRTISDFRKDNLEHMQSLFMQTLLVCQQAGLVKFGRVALDGSSVKSDLRGRRDESGQRCASGRTAAGVVTVECRGHRIEWRIERVPRRRRLLQ